jgi:hypothetical protein
MRLVELQRTRRVDDSGVGGWSQSMETYAEALCYVSNLLLVKYGSECGKIKANVQHTMIQSLIGLSL